jgi:ribosomal protein S18 acetylase RimI-like enzyme
MDADALTALIDATWPTKSARVTRGWRIRHDPAGGNRVSATTALLPGSGRGALDAPLYMIRPGEEALDARLSVQGYLRKDPTLVMTAPTQTVRKELPRDRVVYCEAPVARLKEVWAEGGIGTGRLAIMRRVQCPASVLMGRKGDRIGGAAFIAHAAGIAMLHALHVSSEARRDGLGTDLTHGFANWAATEGIKTLSLLVTEANGPAFALYKGLGFKAVARYHYRKRPGREK